MESQESVLTDIVPAEEEASAGQRIAANIIDLILAIGVLVASYKMLPNQLLDLIIEHRPISTYLFAFVILVLYRFVVILLLQRTIGMIIFRCKYLNENLKPLSVGEKVIVTFVTRTKKIRIYKVGS